MITVLGIGAAWTTTRHMRSATIRHTRLASISMAAQAGNSGLNRLLNALRKLEPTWQQIFGASSLSHGQLSVAAEHRPQHDQKPSKLMLACRPEPRFDSAAAPQLLWDTYIWADIRTHTSYEDKSMSRWPGFLTSSTLPHCTGTGAASRACLQQNVSLTAQLYCENA